MKNYIFIILFVVLLGIVALAQPADAAANPYNYTYYQTHTIGGSSTTLNDYQVNISVYNTAGTSSGNVMFTGGHMSSFPYDIGFFNASTGAPLYYWVEQGTSNSTYAKYWLNITSLGTGGYNVLIKYGNTSATSTSNPYHNGYGTFRFFDGFDDGTQNTSTWYKSAPGFPVGNTSYSNGLCVMWTEAGIYTKSAVWKDNTELQYRFKTDYVNNASINSFFWAYSSVEAANGTYAGYSMPGDASVHYKYAKTKTGSSTISDAITGVSASTWYTQTAKRGNGITWQVNGGSTVAQNSSSYVTDDLILRWRIDTGNDGAEPEYYGYTYLDYAFIRNSTSTEPAHSTWTTEVTYIMPSDVTFTGTPLEGSPPLMVSYTGAGNNVTSWQYILGDGAIATTQNTSHNYNTSGLYTITIIGSNGNGTMSLTRERYLNIQGVPALISIYVRNFGVQAVSGATLTIYQDGAYIYSGTTDSNGMVGVTLLTDRQYSYTLINGTTINQSGIISPASSPYYINTWSTSEWKYMIPGFRYNISGTPDPGWCLQSNVTTATNETAGFIVCNYTDVNATTTSVTFRLMVYYTNGTYVELQNKTVTPTAQTTASTTFTVYPAPAGTSYIVRTDGISNWGTHNFTLNSADFKPKAVSIPLIGDWLWPWIIIGLVIVVVFMGGARNQPITMFLVAAVLSLAEWFSLWTSTNQTWVTMWQYHVIIGLAILLGFLWSNSRYQISGTTVVKIAMWGFVWSMVMNALITMQAFPMPLTPVDTGADMTYLREQMLHNAGEANLLNIMSFGLYYVTMLWNFVTGWLALGWLGPYMIGGPMETVFYAMQGLMIPLSIIGVFELVTGRKVIGG